MQYICSVKENTRAMCRISTETIKRANERTKERYRNGDIKPVDGGANGVTVEVAYSGRVYRQRITTDQIKKAYRAALKVHVKAI